MLILDCTLRDGGYYNNWNFPRDVVKEYLEAMISARVDVVELGMRSIDNRGFKGAVGFSTDEYLNDLSIPSMLKVAVMVNASELLCNGNPQYDVLENLFPLSANASRVDVVRIACHVHEFERVLPVSRWLKNKGYIVGFNLMQVADRSKDEIIALSKAASEYELDTLYFADSMGSMTPEHCRTIIGWLNTYWKGPLGIHTHDNMGLALQNTLTALEEGVTWLDSTVTGMGRGPGNARTEELVIEIADRKGYRINLVPLLSVIRNYFQPLKNKCGWGSNPYYYLSGKYGIHPTYVQEMLSDARYDEEDILAVIDHLRVEGGKKFSLDTLSNARDFYKGTPMGEWHPISQLKDRSVLLLGAGPGVTEHRTAIESYIRKVKPLVIALNTLSSIAAELIDFRIACHPVRLLADCETHCHLPQPLITPFSMLPENVKSSLAKKEILDFGLHIKPDVFEFSDNHCVAPTSLVAAYALAVATSGQARQILMAGFDGFGADDPRSQEMSSLLELYLNDQRALKVTSITPTRYGIHTESVYAL